VRTFTLAHVELRPETTKMEKLGNKVKSYQGKVVCGVLLVKSVNQMIKLDRTKEQKNRK
jgi:hypothetical protein